MARINVGKVMCKEKKGVPYQFVLPDIIKVLNTKLNVGDELIVPINSKDDNPVFWEFGGRNKDIVSSIGTVVAGADDKLLNAILFNKLGPLPNGKHALITLRPECRLYAGKISVRQNILAPTIRIVRLIYNGIDEEETTASLLSAYGNFRVDAILTDYASIEGCLPAERLIEKLFTCNVMKPYFSNGWLMPDIATNGTLDDIALLTDIYNKILNIELEVESNTIANMFLDSVENFIVNLKNQKLSVVMQHLNFEKEIITLIPLKNTVLSNLRNTISKAIPAKRFEIKMSDMLKCYNPNILFGSEDIGMLEFALSRDTNFTVKIGPREYVVIRGFRG